MKKLVAMLLLICSFHAGAAEVDGVKLDDKAQVDGATLQLNGAGLRSIFGIIKPYVAALYLLEKKTGADAVLNEPGAKRIALHVLLAGEPEHFLKPIRKGIEKNHTQQEVEALRERMDAFDRMFADIKEFKKGDVIAFDWLPGVGTRVSVNGKELGRVGGGDFYRALLSIWIGAKPVTEGLKKDLLGG